MRVSAWVTRQARMGGDLLVEFENGKKRLYADVRKQLLRVWRSMDDPNGKMGITVRVLGENVTLLGNMSPKKAMVAAMLMGSTAFWLGTAIGLCIFELMFDVPPDVKERGLHAASVGLAAMYISVMAGIVHVVFFRDRHLWAVDALDRAL